MRVRRRYRDVQDAVGVLVGLEEGHVGDRLVDAILHRLRIQHALADAHVGQPDQAGPLEFQLVLRRAAVPIPSSVCVARLPATIEPALEPVITRGKMPCSSSSRMHADVEQAERTAAAEQQRGAAETACGAFHENALAHGGQGLDVAVTQEVQCRAHLVDVVALTSFLVPTRACW